MADTDTDGAIIKKHLADGIRHGDIIYAGIERAYHDDPFNTQCEQEEPVSANETIYEIRVDLDPVVDNGEVFRPDPDEPDSLLHYVTLVLDWRHIDLYYYDCSEEEFTRRRVFIDLQAPIDTSSMDDYNEIRERL